MITPPSGEIDAGETPKERPRAVLAAERGLVCRVGNVCERFRDFHWLQTEILKSYILFFSLFIPTALDSIF